MNSKFNYLPLYSELLTESEKKNILDKFSKTIIAAGGNETSDKNAAEDDRLLFFILTGGTENIFLNIHKERNKNYPNEPVYLIAHSGNNSLPASMEILAKIKQEGRKGKIIYLSGNEENDKNLLSVSIRNLNAFNKMTNTSLGLIGKPSDWLIASSPDPSIVKNTWGINVKEFDIKVLQNIYHEISESEVLSQNEKFKTSAKSIVEPRNDELINSIKVYSALKKITEENNLSSISVRCFDILTDEKTTGCFALSQLTDEGIIAGCEGDLVTTIGMLWAHLMFDSYPWMANPSRIDINDNRLILAHCTVPRKIVTEYDIRSHFESGIGVGIQGNIEPGPVTLLRLGGKDLKSLWLAEGEIISNLREENLCRTQVEIRLHDRNKLKELLHNPLGNHLILIHGFHADELEEWHNEFIV